MRQPLNIVSICALAAALIVPAELWAGDSAAAEDARQKAGDFLAYGATALVLGMIDAYVSAHLYNFDRHFAIAPSGGARITLALRF